MTTPIEDPQYTHDVCIYIYLIEYYFAALYNKRLQSFYLYYYFSVLELQLQTD